MVSSFDKKIDLPGATAATHSPAPDAGPSLDAIERRHQRDIAELRDALNDLKAEVSDLKAVIINRHEDRSVIVVKLNELSRKVDTLERGSLRGAGIRYLLPIVRSTGRLFRKQGRGGV